MRLVYTKLSRMVAAALLAAAFAGANLAAFAEEATQDDEWYTGPAYVAPEPDETAEQVICKSQERTEIAMATSQEELFELTENLEECELE